MGAKFELGHVVATPAALARLEAAEVTGASLLDRHAVGDWGTVDDPAENEEALREGERLLSVYEVSTGTVWIITERDRSVTTLLTPGDY